MGKLAVGLRAKVEAKCAICKQTFSCIRLRLVNSKSGKVCCSLQCWYKLRKKIWVDAISKAMTVARVPITCSHCKTIFKVKPCNKTIRKYCSRQCYFASREHQYGYCVICKDKHVQHKRSKYCSLECRYESIRRQYKVKRNSKPYLLVNCTWCSKPCKREPNRFEKYNKTKQAFCDKDCWRAWWKNIGVAAVTSNNQKKLHARPNIPEKIMLTLLKPLGFRYTGNGAVSIDRFNPDFIHKKLPLIIEFFGEYWHDPVDMARRKYYYNKHGYKCMVVWQKQLYTSSELVVRRVKRFIAKAA